jgi:hypothetical protein
MKHVPWASAALAVAAAIQLVGCTPAPAPAPGPAPTTPATSAEHGHDHPHSGHGAGPHEGTLADWGGGKYHVEFTVDHDKKEAVVYVLGSDEKTPAPVKTPDGKLLLTITEPATQIQLVASPLEGESDGASSRYTGTHETLGIVREFAGSISAEVDGTPYAGDFKEEPHGAHDHK